jgi:hypothetical protein
VIRCAFKEMGRLHWRAIDRPLCSKKYKGKTRTVVSSAPEAGIVNSVLCWFYYELVYGEGSIRLEFSAEREGKRSPQLRRYALSMAPHLFRLPEGRIPSDGSCLRV